MKRTVTLRGKEVAFTSRKLRSGETAYYRDGKRQTTSYGNRIAKGILSGKTLSQARGHPNYLSLREKGLTSVEIEKEIPKESGNPGTGEYHQYGEWAEPPRSKGGGMKKHYYAKVRVSNESIPRGKKYDPTASDDVCTTLTVSLFDPYHNEQTGFTYAEISRKLGQIIQYTLKRYRLALCTNNLQADVLGVWRHV